MSSLQAGGLAFLILFASCALAVPPMPTIKRSALAAPPKPQTQSVTLIWNASTSTNVIGYYLYYGVASHTYTNRLDALGSLSGTILNLRVGTIYYFAATAYDNLGRESDFSNEVSYVVPMPRYDTVVTLTGSGSIYGGTNLNQWLGDPVAFLALGGSISFTNPPGNRFFRAEYAIDPLRISITSVRKI